MKLKLVSAVFLLICFLWFGIASDAVPVITETSDAQTISETMELMVQNSSSPEETPIAGEIDPTQVPTESAEPAATETPEITPEPAAATEQPASEPAEQAELSSSAWNPDITVIPTTIRSDSILDNSTSYEVDADALLAEGPGFTLSPDGYQILIIHTHATEAYTPDGDDIYEASDDYRTTDTEHSVVRVGQALADALSAYGLNVLHDTGLYDYPSYNGSYSRCGEAVEEYLAAYPNISIVIDLHRDALGSEDTIYKTVTAEADAAQIMLVIGSDVNLEHPNWRTNLALALTLQQSVQALHSTLMRPTELCSYRYNQQLAPGYLLMEVGTTGNTLQEAIRAVELFAEGAGPVLAGMVAAEG